MDLLQENNKKNNKTPAQKLILVLLVVSIVLCFIIGILIVYVSTIGESHPLSFSINGKITDNNILKLIELENGNKYVSLKAISNLLGYNYYNGEYKIAGEDKNKGYIDNGINIVQFFVNSQEIYKTTENTNTDFQYYKLQNNILEKDGNLYIEINDLDVALNLILNYSENNNQITIDTSEYYISKIEPSLNQNNITINKSSDNLKALSYGYIVVSKDEKNGVIKLNRRRANWK